MVRLCGTALEGVPQVSVNHQRVRDRADALGTLVSIGSYEDGSNGT